MDERRVGLAKRELAMGALDEHRRADRLDATEYHRRSAIAARARARAELDGLFTDLPPPRPDFGDPGPPERDVEHTPAPPTAVDREPTAGEDDRAVDLPELVTPLAAVVARHAGLLSVLTPVIAFGLFAATGFRFPFVFLLVPVTIGVLTWWGHRNGA